jgi:hypothetical protein
VEFFFFFFSRIVLWLQFGALFIFFFIQLGHLVSFGKSMFDMVG